MLTKVVNTLFFLFSFSLFTCAPKTQVLDIYNNGKTKLIREYKVTKNGVRSDSVTTKFLKYHRNGMRFYVQDILEGEPNGNYRSWFQSGKNYAKGNYINGQLSGKWTWYGDDGLLDSVRSFHQDALYGDYIDYFNNGKPQLIIEYVDNKKHGNYKEYDKEGQKNYLHMNNLVLLAEDCLD